MMSYLKKCAMHVAYFHKIRTQKYFSFLKSYSYQGKMLVKVLLVTLATNVSNKILVTILETTDKN